jgi:curved DNA-binding protein CbpA
MAFQISQGLFSQEFTDLHALLGVSIEAPQEEVRKCYLRIARRLHPDSLTGATPEEKQQASDILSKLVNPAYKKLMAKDKDLAEYQLLLKLKGQEAFASQRATSLTSDMAKELLQAKDWGSFYKKALHELAQQQYEALTHILSITGAISELNLAYLLRREGGGGGAKVTSSGTTQPTTAQSTTSPITSGQIPTDASDTAAQRQAQSSLSMFIEQYCRRAEDLIQKNQFAAAIQELRDALKDDPTNSRCNALLGKVYLKQGQLTMARIYFDQALKYDPKNAAAVQGKLELEKQQKKASPAKGKESSDAKPASDKSGGLFGGLFGGKKK